MKKLIITEKPSVASSFAKALEPSAKRENGYFEGNDYVITWCVGHLITLCMPEIYDASLKKWEIERLPFVPEIYKYQVIEAVQEQYETVAKCLNRSDIDAIYYAGDSAREGEYIQRLVRDKAGRNRKATEKRVWIDSQTDEEIRKGVTNAKPLSSYDNLADAGYMRAIEDFLIGINYSRALSLKYGNAFNDYIKTAKYTPISVGRVMTCVLGMVVERERQIREAIETPFYGVNAILQDVPATLKWKSTPASAFYKSLLLLKEDAFANESDAKKMAQILAQTGKVNVVEKEIVQEKKYAPALFNLAELQHECSKQFKISPDETLKVAQSLYEKKLTTYPRTDARVLSNAVAKEIDKNLSGLTSLPSPIKDWAKSILAKGTWKGISTFKKYTDDTKISDHYAIIPTGKTQALSGLEEKVYTLIVKRFLSVFLPPATYEKVSLKADVGNESFFASAKYLQSLGYLALYNPTVDKQEFDALNAVSKGIHPASFVVAEGKTGIPKHFNSGTLILAMENAGNLIEDEELREQIKGCGIGTSATRAETIKKLVSNGYIDLNDKTQQVKATKAGEIVYEIVCASLPSLLSPKMTASWEKGLSAIEKGTVLKTTYQDKLNTYVAKEIEKIKSENVLEEIKENITKLQKIYPNISDGAKGASNNSIVCPFCGRKMYTKEWGMGCTGFNDGCKFSLFKKTPWATLTDAQLRNVLEKGKTSKLKLKSKAGNDYEGYLTLNKATRKLELEFAKANTEKRKIV